MLIKSNIKSHSCVHFIIWKYDMIKTRKNFDDKTFGFSFPTKISWKMTKTFNLINMKFHPRIHSRASSFFLSQSYEYQQQWKKRKNSLMVISINFSLYTMLNFSSSHTIALQFQLKMTKTKVYCFSLGFAFRSTTHSYTSQ